MGCTPGITSPREDCRSSDKLFKGKLFLVNTPQGCHICFIIPNKMQKHKGEKLQIESLDKYWSSALFVELVSPVGHSANSVGVRGYASG